eukprot:1121890-Amphidinium_carterae.1
MGFPPDRLYPKQCGVPARGPAFSTKLRQPTIPTPMYHRGDRQRAFNDVCAQDEWQNSQPNRGTMHPRYHLKALRYQLHSDKLKSGARFTHATMKHLDVEQAENT